MLCSRGEACKHGTAMDDGAVRYGVRTVPMGAKERSVLERDCAIGCGSDARDVCNFGYDAHCAS